MSQFNDEVYKTYSTSRHKLGAALEFADGRRYRFALNGATQLAAAVAVQMPVPEPNHKNIAVAAAAAVGAESVSVTLGATAAAADLYKDGYMYTNDAAGEGYIYAVKGHDAIGSEGTGTINLYENTKVIVALTTSSQVTLVRNPWAAVIVHPSPPTAAVVGVTPTLVAANYYFWAQVAGPTVILTDGTLVIGDECIPSASVDGAASPRNYTLTEGTPNTLDGSQELPALGQVMNVNADTEHSLIMLRSLDGGGD